MASEISMKDQLSSLLSLSGDKNYPMWNQCISAFLKNKELYTKVPSAPSASPTGQVLKKISESANILLTKISNKLYNCIITAQKNNNRYIIWTRMLDLFAKRTGLRLS